MPLNTIGGENTWAMAADMVVAMVADLTLF